MPSIEYQSVSELKEVLRINIREAIKDCAPIIEQQFSRFLEKLDTPREIQQKISKIAADDEEYKQIDDCLKPLYTQISLLVDITIAPYQECLGPYSQGNIEDFLNNGTDEWEEAALAGFIQDSISNMIEGILKNLSILKQNQKIYPDNSTWNLVTQYESQYLLEQRGKSYNSIASYQKARTKYVKQALLEKEGIDALYLEEECSHKIILHAIRSLETYLEEIDEKVDKILPIQLVEKVKALDEATRDCRNISSRDKSSSKVIVKWISNRMEQGYYMNCIPLLEKANEYIKRTRGSYDDDLSLIPLEFEQVRLLEDNTNIEETVSRLSIQR